MRIELAEAFKLTSYDGNKHKHYIFIDGHPVDISRPKYKLYKEWNDINLLFCFSCLKPATHFQLVKTKGEGSIYKDGSLKYTLKLKGDDGIIFTLDHWYPRTFLKNNRLQAFSNKVPMCVHCNKEKGIEIPIIGKYKKTFYMPVLGERGNENFDYWRYPRQVSFIE